MPEEKPDLQGLVQMVLKGDSFKEVLSETSYKGGFHCTSRPSITLTPHPPQPNDPVTNICQAADKQLFTLVEWAKRIPHFSSLPLDDQVILLRAGQ